MSSRRSDMTDHLDATRVTAVVFDFVGVLTQNPGGLVRDRAEQAGVSAQDVLPLLAGPVDEDTDHPWHKVERGEITLAEFDSQIDIVLREAGIHAAIRPPSPDEMREHLRPIPEMEHAARVLRSAGYRTAIVTNNVKEWGWWRALVDADDLVDAVIDSAHVGMRKPSAAIYELAASRLDVATGACLMLDDFEWNVRGAERAGMQALHVTDPVVDSGAVIDLLLPG